MTDQKTEQKHTPGPWWPRDHQAPEAMTDEQVKSARRSVCDDPDELPEPWAFRMGIRAAEAHHGITAQGAQEGV